MSNSILSWIDEDWNNPRKHFTNPFGKGKHLNQFLLGMCWKRYYNFPSGCYCAFHLQKAAMMCQTMCIKKIDKYHNRSLKYNNHGHTCNRMRKDIFEKLLYMYAQLFMIKKRPHGFTSHAHALHLRKNYPPLWLKFAIIFQHKFSVSCIDKKINKHVY